MFYTFTFWVFISKQWHTADEARKKINIHFDITNTEEKQITEGQAVDLEKETPGMSFHQGFKQPLCNVTVLLVQHLIYDSNIELLYIII